MKSIFLVLTIISSLLFTQFSFASEKCSKKCTPDPVTQITNITHIQVKYALDMSPVFNKTSKNLQYAVTRSFNEDSTHVTGLHLGHRLNDHGLFLAVTIAEYDGGQEKQRSSGISLSGEF